MSRLKNRTTQFLIDIGVLMLAFLLATLVRFDWNVPPSMFRNLLVVLPYVVLLQYAFLSGFGITRFSWRFISLRDAVRILVAVASASAILVAVRFLSPALVDRFPIARYGIVPLGVLLGDFLLAFLGLSGVRAFRRLIGERSASKAHGRLHDAPAPTLLVGAGQGGVLVAQELSRRPDLGVRPVAFVDDDPVKQGAVIHGIKVMGTTSDLERLVERFEAKQALITISSAPGAAIRRITERCSAVGLATKIVPGTYQIVGGRVNLSRIRDVAIEDLLRREQVKLDSEAVADVVRGQRVMITGAGGSIGSELCRQVAAYAPSSIVLVERSENALFEIHSELRERFGDIELVPRVADITDVSGIRAVFRQHRPKVVFHAAAHKHVPMMEWNAVEAVKNNVLGTQIVADLADDHAVERFVMISTDKAVNPASVMGATKRAAELYVQALSMTSATHFSTVRFGNVLGSAGSVIPIFRRQIREGGPITVTHPDMTRYFMTIPEAVQLVMQAAALSRGGETFILDMGAPVRILDLAHDLIRLSGMEPDKDVEIRFTGVRPGEKLFEELSTTSEGLARTAHPKIFTGSYESPHLPALRTQLDAVRTLCDAGSADEIKRALSRLVPEYGEEARRSEPPPRVNGLSHPKPAEI
ncbi:MAG: polysaccharide biosynthesis protein [Deltaproteobacteria bacterium]|jgi:FlaA1/EpsC-like NDP-sugar epimerase|nr:polysaccharide biosynthesis protein [Deltaproteobacteria bacterium]